MAEVPQNQYYQAPLEVPGYVNPGVSKVPAQPIRDIYGLFGVAPGKPAAARKKNPYELMMDGGDPFAGIIPDVAPLQTNLKTIEPLDDPAGLFHSQDGYGKYGYSSILHGGDNEDRYAQNFRKDNPDLFWRPGFHPWEGIKKAFYWGGGFLEKTLESAVVKTGQGLAGLYGLTIGNSLDLLAGNGYDSFADWLSRGSDNVFSNFFDGWDDNLKSRYHYFQEKSDRDKKGFLQSLGDGDFWMNDVSDGLGFLVSAAFEVGLISKLGLGAKAATRLAPLAEGVAGAEAVAGGAGQASRIARVANILGVEGGGHSFIKNGVDLASQTLVTTAIESAAEATEAKEKIMSSFEGKINPETGMYYTTEEKERLAAAGAAQVFKQNMAILIGPKFLETLVFNRIGKAFKGMVNKGVGAAQTEAGKASGAVRSRLGNLASGTSYEKAGALKNIWKIGSASAIGFVSEGLFEENIQLAISRTAEDTFGAGDEFYRPGTSKQDVDKMEGEDELFGNVKRKYWDQTKQFFRGVGDSRFIDDELSKSIGIGGAFGIGGGAIHSTIGLRQQAKIDNYWNNRINRATNSLFESQSFFKEEEREVPDPANPGKTIKKSIIVTDPQTGQPVLDENKLKGFLNKMNNIQGIMDIINNTEDPNDENNKLQQNKELNKLARNVLFTNLAMEYIRAGKKNVLLQNLASSSNLSDKDIQALGYEPGTLSMEEKKAMLSKLTKMVERLSNSDQWIEDNVIDNVSEPRQGFGGMRYTKTQKEKRQQEFEAKKAYLRGLAMQSTLLDSYLDEIAESEAKLGEPGIDILSSVLDENGVPVTDFSVPLDTVTRNFNSRIPALKNQISVLQKEFAYHWDNIESRERNSPKAGEFNNLSKTNAGKNLFYSQVKADETLERINDLQEELDKLTAERGAFLNNDKAFELREEDGEFYVLPKNQKGREQLALEQLQAEKQRRINGVKREEIGIQKKWIDNEWQQTAALKEEKTKVGRQETYFSRRMSLSKNAYNTYFQREVMDRDNSLGQRKLRLAKDKITTKQYKSNEEKLLKAVRIQGKVQTIIAEVNGQKLLAEIQALLDRNLGNAEFTAELKTIIDNYNGKPIVIKNEDKSLVDEQLDAARDEYNFVANMMEFMPEDDRFNDKYYDINQNGQYIIKPEYDSLPDIARVTNELQDRIDELEKIKNYLNSIPEEIPGDWNNINVVKKRIADVYTETADSVINTYNQLSNNGQSEVAGDSLSTKQDLDLINDEIDEIEALKKIFLERPDMLATPEFKDFIAGLDERLETLKKIKEIVKERLSSRLRENQDFLIDAVNNFTEQLGLAFDGTILNQDVHDAIEKVVGGDVLSKLKTTLTDLKQAIEKEEQDAENKKYIADAYWKINGQIAAIQQVIKMSDKKDILSEISKQKSQEISNLNSTALMQKIKDQKYYKEIQDVLPDSLLGALQVLFYQSEFSEVGVAGGGDTSFLDDQPSSPVYRFREDYNLRKFIRAIDRDNSRTPENSTVSKEEILEFLNIAKKIQNFEDLQKALESNLNLIDQVEREKEVVQAKIDKKDNKYENLIVSSIQQLFFIRNIASFLRRDTGITGFKNWIYIQAPGGAGKTQTLGTWFNTISGIPRDRVLATAFTEEAARGIKKALLVGEQGPKDAQEMIEFIKELTKKGDFSQEVLIIDEFPAIDVQTQKGLYEAIEEYSKAKKAKDGNEFKVITMGDTNQLTFAENGSVTPRPTIIINPKFFGKDVHPARMSIIPSLTVNFRSNLFAVTSFIDQFKGSNAENVNATLKVTSTDPSLTTKNVKGVVSVDKANFQQKVVNYIKTNQDSTRTRALIVNESKIDAYKKLLTDNGIKVITDPNDEVTKGVYVSSVKNTQGFSFDEVFIDLENNDKTLFAGTANLNYIYNKAMYVAASRARNLIVATNFPNFENVEDESINTLENKALEELQTKDTEFIANRDQEITGAKEILGNNYSRQVSPAVKVTATEEKVETPLDLDEEEETEDLEDIEEETEETPEEKVTEEKEPEVEETGEAEEETTPTGGEVIESPGVEDESEVQAEEKKTHAEAVKEMMENIKDKTVTAFDRIRKGVVELLFPTGQTIKYKVSDGDFTKFQLDEYENKNLTSGDKIILVPFQKSKNSKSPRKFGYAIVTPAIDQDGKTIDGSYRTVAVLSDYEIDNLKEAPETKKIFDSIEQNEQREAGFVSLLYSDVSDENGFRTDSGKVINELEVGTVSHANPVTYFYGDDFREMNQSEMNKIIDEFIAQFYKNHIDSFPPERQAGELDKLRKFYQDKDNAQIIIPTNKDISGKNPRLKVPPELRTYVRTGRPYLVFRPFHRRSTMQFVGLSRKYLSGKDHQHVLAPIQKFVRLGKVVRDMLEKKGVTNKMGYSKSLSNFLGKAATMYVKDSGQSTYTVTLNTTNEDGKRVSRDIDFSNVEMERVYKLYSMYQEPNTQVIKAETEKEIQNLTKVKRARNYIFDDGTVIFGTIVSYDSTTKTFVVKDQRTGEEQTKGGVIHHTAKSYTGQVQQILDDVMNSNGSIAQNFISTRGKVGFVTDKDRSASNVVAYKGYKFMNLLGSKIAPVVKSYDQDGNVKEFYQDVIEILEDLFTFGVRGELPSKKLTYIDNENTIHTTEVKFRVPVPISSRNENGELEYDYTFSPQNTSRDSSVSNSRFFESNFESLLPSRVFIEFGEEAPATEEVAEEVTEQVIEQEQEEQAPVKDVKNLTKEEITTLSFSELRERLTSDQVQALNAYAAREGFGNIDTFFETAESSHPEEQALFRDYIIECLL